MGIQKLTLGGFNDLAEKDGFVVVYPDAVEGKWNDGSGVQPWRSHRENINDVGFISALIDCLGREFRIDNTRIYSAGFSNGGMMCFRLGCELAKRMAGIATVAAGMWEGLPDRYPKGGPISVLMFNATEDPRVPWEGGVTRANGQTFMNVLSASDTVKFWVARNRSCPPCVSTIETNGNSPGQLCVKKEVFGPGAAGSEVVLYTIVGGGHTWPGGYQYLEESEIGSTCHDINACELIWGFFKRHLNVEGYVG